jgi:hypothetical protein
MIKNTPRTRAQQQPADRRSQDRERLHHLN